MVTSQLITITTDHLYLSVTLLLTVFLFVIVGLLWQKTQKRNFPHDLKNTEKVKKCQPRLKP